MIRGIYTAASALRAAATHQGRLAHNLANLQTTGFKQILTPRQAYQSQRMNRFGEHYELTLASVGKLENGLLIPNEIIDLSPGELIATDRTLDLAISGEGFFRVQTPNGERYTRDGSFHRDSQGQLVTRDGYQLLNSKGQVIILPQGDLVVTQTGALSVNGEYVGQIGLANFADQNQLVAENNNLFRGIAPQQIPAEEMNIRQGYLESSNVDENSQVVEMMRILRLYKASQNTIQIQDRLLNELFTVGESS
jgi:flagellar basal body rod protein FlgG